MSEIRIEELTARYDASPVLTSVDLVVPSGSLTCVLGESGCGKTTLLRVIAGFTPARSGRVHIGDRVVDDGTTRVAPEKRRVGYVPQEGALFPHLTVADNIGFALPRRTGADRRARAETVGEMLELVRMPDFGRRYPHELSGGQQQRISIARALANRPEVVLLDEPFASLDATMRGHFREEIREVLRTAGATAILVTHDRSEALSLGDHVAVINAGRVHQTASPTVLYTQPADAHVATFVGDANLLPCTLAGGRAQTALGPLDVHPACPIGDRSSGIAVVRPEHVHVHAVGEVDPARHPGAVGVLTRAEYYGHDARLEVRLDEPDADGAPRTVIARIAAQTPPEEGTSVVVCVDGPVWILADPADPATT